MNSEDGFLCKVAPGLIRLRERFWVADTAAAASRDISYPAAAQAKLAEIEDSSFWFRHRNEVIFAVIDRFPPGGPILDIGGGNGYVAAGLKRRGVTAIVIEPGADGARVACDRGLTVVATSFRPEIFAAAQLPAIGLFDVIEHVDDDRRFLADCCATMAAGGYAYITVPALRFLWSCDDEFAGHYRRYDRRSLSRALTETGFEILRLSYFFSALVPAILLFRTLPSAVGLRSVDTIGRAIRHHQAGSGPSVRAERMLAFEQGLVASGYDLPIGSSLIAVARKRGSH
jgi:SAM-dependent methyltransferase